MSRKKHGESDKEDTYKRKGLKKTRIELKKTRRKWRYSSRISSTDT
jgi:hypothetical protein